MGIENLPDDEKEVIDILAKAGYLKLETDVGSIALESSNTVNIQPKGTPFGAKLRAEHDGSVTPTLTFDTKKMRSKNKKTDPKKALDDAIEEYLSGIGTTYE